ncbi:MAG: hypothetical protein C0412_01780 [Flavobacterium sp.]|nr:hypothetical protein [Flavobacterium sp.]
MDNLYFILFVILCVFTHIIRTVYEILKHKKIIEPNRITFAVIFSNMALLWISWFSLCSMDQLKITLPDIVKYIGLFICIAGLIMFLTALFTIKTLETYNGDLITKGIYSKIRHPMYLGFICWLIGFPFFSGGGFSFLLAVIFITNVLIWRHLEEIELGNRFPHYNEYKIKTFF